MWGGWVCDLVVTPCDLAAWGWQLYRSKNSCCCVWAELWSCHGGSWICTSARCVCLWVLVGDWDAGACLRCALATFACNLRQLDGLCC